MAHIEKNFPDLIIINPTGKVIQVSNKNSTRKMEWPDPKLLACDDNQKKIHISTIIQAFHEGAWVIIDEMNTLPLEHLLNALLSGTMPEGLLAKAPGFFVTGTQNPINFGKRSAYSEAFLNRFQKLDLKDFGKEDLQVITTRLMEDSKEAEKMVDYFIEA